MTKIVIMVKDGIVQEVLCRNKNIEVEVLDLDTQDAQSLISIHKRYNELNKCKSYKNIL